MSVGPLGGIVGSAAGAPLSQTQGSETERAQKDQASRAREADNAQQAERASGIGETQEDQQTSDRDADGRRLWEGPTAEPSETPHPNTQPPTESRPSKDPTGNAGTQLDLTG